ncbi:Homeodomain-like protein, partial [Ochromonadaceae sp. CCMP2298]
GRWTNHEHEMFVAALQVHGKKWKKVASMIKTRTAVQIRTHAQKYFIKMNK